MTHQTPTTPSGARVKMFGLQPSYLRVTAFKPLNNNNNNNNNRGVGGRSSGTHDGVLHSRRHVLLLLLEVLDLLQGEEGLAAPAHRLLGVRGAPDLEGLRVAALHVQPQVLPVLGGEVAQAAGERLLTWPERNAHGRFRPGMDLFF